MVRQAFKILAAAFLSVSLLVSCQTSGKKFSLAEFFSTVSGTGGGGDTNEAEKFYPDYLRIADAYMDLEKYNEAITYYEYVLPSESLHYDALYKLGRANALAGNWEKAKEFYEELLDRDAENFSFHASLAYITAMSGDVKEAIKLYAHLCETHPEDQTVLENYITLLLTDGDAEVAQHEIENLETSFPDSTQLETFKEKLESLLENGDEEDGAETDAPEDDGEETETVEALEVTPED